MKKLLTPCSPYSTAIVAIASATLICTGMLATELTRVHGRTESMAPPPPQPAAAVDFDFDGDGKSDLSRWHPANIEFKIKNSNGGSYSTYTTVATSSSDKLAPADYDGDGKTDVATFNAGTWKIRDCTSTCTITTVSGFGQAGDIPMSGDYRSTAAHELAFYRPSNSTWYWRELTNPTVYSVTWGASGDVPVAGDYEGDGFMDPAVFRPSNGTWYFVQSSNSSQVSYGWGQSGDVPLAGDFDGDGRTDLTVFRPSSGMWYAAKSGTSYSSWLTQAWGNYSDQPVSGDFDGDGKADYAIWRPSSGVWYIMKSGSGLIVEALGAPGDTAVVSSYVKQVGSDVAPDLIAKARLDPQNATGGTDLYSQNFSWGRQLVGLPGRSGLDLGLGISYNSLVWTKVGTTMLFDPDYSNVSPGFRLDFPNIEPAYYDGDTGKYNYLMVTPSGARLQFRQTASATFTRRSIPATCNWSRPVPTTRTTRSRT